MEQLLPFWFFWRLNELKWGKCLDWHVESGKHSIMLLAITIISVTALTTFFIATRVHSRMALVWALWGTSSLLFHPHNTKKSLLQRRYCTLKCIGEEALGQRARLVFFSTSFSNSPPGPLRNHLPSLLAHVSCVRLTLRLGSRAPGLIQLELGCFPGLGAWSRDGHLSKLHEWDQGPRILLEQ